MTGGEIVTAIEVIVKIGVAVHDKIEQIKANKAQCVELCKHLTIVIGHLHLLGEKKYSTAPEFVQAISNLKACAVKCENLILKYSDEKKWIKRVWKAGSNEGAFKRCHKQLSQYLQQMCTAIGLQLLDSYQKNTKAILSDTNDIKERTQDIVKQQLAANESLTTINHGHQIIATLQQNAERRLAQLLEGQKRLDDAIIKSKPLNNASYKIRLDEVIFDEEISLGEEVQAPYTLYKGKLDGQPVAVKLLHGNFSDDKTLAREAEILSNLHCDKVINLLGACFEKAGGLIVMEAAENGSLEDIIRSKFPLSSSLKERIATEIVLGLHYLHTKKVYYKELNAGSILFNKDWRVKLANFNRSSAQAFSISSVPLEGEESVWRAPELLEEKQYYDKKAADIYSLGLVLWSLWSDELPYQNAPKGGNAFKKFILDGNREVLTKDIPPVFQDIIKGCWASKPDDRMNIDEIIKRIKLDTLNSLIASEGAVIASFEKEYQELSDSLAKTSLCDYYRSKWGEMRVNKICGEGTNAGTFTEEKSRKLSF